MKTVHQQLEELNCIRVLLDFRLKRQRLLIKKIDEGRWKSPIHPKVLHALAEMDLKLLVASVKETAKKISEFKETQSETIPENVDKSSA